ncbi:MAG: prephenate dehydrogenase/arogenate dehydrogenase family protein [Candidatus Omnitrophica bacterium]|nr:prephenate dehydrogenase/arogenate dehydrogenase family protein [Candidatus Omnitrophota bacterium]
MKIKKAAIIGMGFIGGSIGRALLDRGITDEVAGVCRRQTSLDRAIKQKVLTAGYVNNYREAVSGADIVFIATPVHVIKDVLTGLAGVIEGGAIVTDVGSTKKDIVESAARLKDSFSFVGGHPLAGSERSGVECADGELFRGSLCVLTRDRSTREQDLARVKALWAAMGAKVEVLSPGKHDEVVAFTSHLPHVLAYSLVGAQKKEYRKYMSTGFKDTSRIASSDPVLWNGILMSNRESVLDSIERFKETLAGIEEALRQGDARALETRLSDYKKVRDEIL